MLIDSNGHIFKVLLLSFVGKWPKHRHQFTLQMSKFRQLPSELDPCLPFLLHNKLFTDTNGKREIVVASITICSGVWNWTGPIRSLFERNALFETRQNWFYARLLQCSIFERSIMYDKCSISQRLIVFDWQNCWVSSIKFNYRTHSKSIERLEFD